MDLEGNKVKLAELRGSPILLELWASWCLPCREQAEIIQGLAEEFDQRGIEVYAVNVGEDPEVVIAHLETFQTVARAREIDSSGAGAGPKPARTPTLDGRVGREPSANPVLLDRAQAISTRLAIGELPALVLLDSDGTVTATAVGLTDRERLLAMLDQLGEGDVARRAQGPDATGDHANASRMASGYGGSSTPTSVMMAVTSCAGVTSKARL